MKAQTGLAIKLIVAAVAMGVVGAAGILAGYRIGVARAFLRDKRLAASPEPVSNESAAWTPDELGGVPATAKTIDKKDPPPREKPAENPPSVASVSSDSPLAIDVTRPVRITWPLEVGPDCCPDRPDDRVCLRSREGANELQTPGTGAALYPFRVAEAGRYTAYCRVRWTDDGTGSIECNNSWFAAFDDMPAAVVGNEEWMTIWFWERGPAARLEKGVHWFRVELREDGPCMDRVVIMPAASGRGMDALGRIEPAAAALAGGFANEAPPLDPQRGLAQAEFWAHPTGSLAIGEGHENLITVGGWWHNPKGPGGEGFTGRVEVACPTAPGLTVSGEAALAVNADAPFVRKVLRLAFPAGATRRAHKVIVRVVGDDGHAAFREEIRFVKPWAWAFMGPFADTAGGSRSTYRGTGNIRRLKHPCDKDPRMLAGMRPAAQLGLAELALAKGHTGGASWKVVSDGSCCSWTGAVDLQRVYGRTGPAFAYAVTWLGAQTRLHHRSFSFQVDDSGWLWMNGEFVVALPVDLPREANRLWTSAALRPGANPVVVKLTQNARYWGFCLDVVDWHWQGRRGDVITGIEPGRWPKRQRRSTP